MNKKCLASLMKIMRIFIFADSCLLWAGVTSEHFETRGTLPHFQDLLNIYIFIKGITVFSATSHKNLQDITWANQFSNIQM